jgi:hypothetical protein
MLLDNRGDTHGCLVKLSVAGPGNLFAQTSTGSVGARACLEANRRLRQQERRSQYAERASCDSRREMRGCWPHRVPDKRAGCSAVRPTLQTCKTMCYPGAFRGDGENHGNLSAVKRRNDLGQTDK